MPFDLRQMLDHFFVRHSRVSRAKSSSPAAVFRGQILQVGRFLFRQTYAAKLFIREFQDAFRCQRVAAKAPRSD